MPTTFPGTTIEVSRLEKGASRAMFDGMFVTGGITLSQMCIMTGLEPYLIQNWVKRGFLTSPKSRVYSKEQFARVTIINTMRDVLQIEKICKLISVIVGAPNDSSDDLISDDELYHRFTDVLAEGDIPMHDPDAVRRAAEKGAEGFAERIPGAKKQLVCILQAMLCANAAAELAKRSAELLYTLE